MLWARKWSGQNGRFESCIGGDVLRLQDGDLVSGKFYLDHMERGNYQSLKWYHGEVYGFGTNYQDENPNEVDFKNRMFEPNGDMLWMPEAFYRVPYDFYCVHPIFPTRIDGMDGIVGGKWYKYGLFWKDRSDFIQSMKSRYVTNDAWEIGFEFLDDALRFDRYFGPEAVGFGLRPKYYCDDNRYRIEWDESGIIGTEIPVSALILQERMLLGTNGLSLPTIE